METDKKPGAADSAVMTHKFCEKFPNILLFSTFPPRRCVVATFREHPTHVQSFESLINHTFLPIFPLFHKVSFKSLFIMIQIRSRSLHNVVCV